MPARKLKGAWWVDFRYERERYRKKSPVNTKRGAEEFERTLRGRLLRGEPLDGEKPQEVPTYQTFVQEWLDTYVATNNKPSTVATK